MKQPAVTATIAALFLVLTVPVSALPDGRICSIVGTPKHDELFVKTTTADTVCARRGGDFIGVFDGIQGNDYVQGGSGHDVCFGDFGDHFRNCELILGPR